MCWTLRGDDCGRMLGGAKEAYGEERRTAVYAAAAPVSSGVDECHIVHIVR